LDVVEGSLSKQNEGVAVSSDDCLLQLCQVHK